MNTDEPREPTGHLGGADGELDQFLSDRLSEYNATATAGVVPARELTVRVLDDEGALVGGVRGWTWGDAGGMGMLWVHPDHRGRGVGSVLLRDFEGEATRRGRTHVFVTSFTFQAPGFYERHGYRELFRWNGAPTPDNADVHFRKDLPATSS